MSEVATIYHSVIELTVSFRRRPYEIHRHVWKAFPELPKATPQPFTFRLLDLEAAYTDKPLCLVQSAIAPKWPEERRKSKLTQPVSVRKYELEEGGSWQYRLHAAPIVKLKREDNRHSRHVAIESAGRIWKWLERRSRQYGFEVDPYSTHFNKERVHIRQHNHKEFFLVRAEFAGELSVVNGGLLKSAIENGVGTKKAYGFGMLNLLPKSARSR